MAFVDSCAILGGRAALERTITLHPLGYEASVRDPAKLTVHTPDRTQKPCAPDAKTVVLKEGPRRRKTATLFEIRDPKRGGLYHDSLKIETLQRVGDGWSDPIESRSLSLEADEIDKLTDFLEARRDGAIPARKGQYLFLSASQETAAIVQKVSELDGEVKTDVLALLLRQAAEKPDLLKDLINRLSEDGGYLEKAVAAMNLAFYETVVDELERLIETSTREADFQSLLGHHPWLFGSEYSEILSRRKWTRDQQLDFMPRRTTDGRVEIIEIKTPLAGRNLFRYDDAHDNLFPIPELTKVEAQVENYLEKLDQDRNSIIISDGIDTNKVCAKIIIGRDGDDAQQAALCRHNGHLHRIEIMTFDGLLAIARRVLSYLQQPTGEPLPGKAESPKPNFDLDDDIPF